ncbi:8908_t:CDS:2 [Ambispora gerdemannii]|uniref:8908_t:CDS:1 n=1 Tax=Ambispora gerdemannii TaxID=144530 RepID=A0A9N8YVX4_9GLOM|nr:8908_t:CDS:2 [Ambispora gerdemannii]
MDDDREDQKRVSPIMDELIEKKWEEERRQRNTTMTDGWRYCGSLGYVLLLLYNNKNRRVPADN